MPSGPTPRVDLSKKQLTAVPEEQLGAATKTLLLHDNLLKSVPASLSSAVAQLVVLYLSNNRLSAWPEAVCELKRLEKLHLEHNLLTVVPESIARLAPTLRKLYLNNNKIQHVANAIGELGLLTHLALHCNLLVALPVDLAKCDALTDLLVGSNPLTVPPAFACNKGADFLRLYLRLMRAAATSGVPAPAFEFHREISFAAGAGAASAPVSPVVAKKDAAPAVAAAAASADASATVKRRKRRTLLTSTVRTNAVHSLIYFLAAVDGMCSQNKRDYMEDRHRVVECCTQRRAATELEAIENLFSRITMLGVFDGHGGQHAAEYLRRYLLPAIANQQSFQAGDFVAALRKAFAVVDDALVKWLWERRIPCGSTAAVVLLVDNVVYVAHCGDTRALLCRDKTAFALTADHTPARDSERARIESRGGEVTRSANGGPMRVNGMLAVSRAFGDVLLKPNGVVTAEPDVCVEPLSPADEWLVVATDGLFDALSNQSVIDVVRRSATPREAAAALVRLACADPESGDNVSVIVVRLHWTIDMLGGRNQRPTGASAVASVAARQRRTLAGIRAVSDDELQRALKVPSIQSTMRGGDMLKLSGRNENPRLAAPAAQKRRTTTTAAAAAAAASAAATTASAVSIDDHVLVKLLVPSINGSKAVVHRCEKTQTAAALHAELCAEHGLDATKYRLYAVTRGDARLVDAGTRMEQAGAADALVLKRADEALPSTAANHGDTVVGASADSVSAVEYATLRGTASTAGASTAAAAGGGAPQLVRGEALPSGWHAARSGDGRVFFFNVETRVTSWQHPGKRVPAPWQAVTTLGNKIYYHNTETAETSWSPRL